MNVRSVTTTPVVSVDDRDDVSFGRDCFIDLRSHIGGPAQDSREFPKLRGRIRVGDRVRVFSFATIDLPSVDDGETLIGDECVLMHYSHVAHDVRLGERVVLANAVQLAGHVHVHEGATLGLNACVHQRVTIGAYAMVGAGAVVVRDVLPFTVVVGNPARTLKFNEIGMQRAGFSEADVQMLRKDGIMLGEHGERVQGLIDLFSKDGGRHK